MDDLTALLAAIIAHPDEDTPRLMYADKLLERNRFVPAGSGLTDDRVIASRIRTSIEEGWEPQRIDYTSRWWPLPENAVGLYHRGFYHAIECNAATFLAHADALLWHEGQTVAKRVRVYPRDEYGDAEYETVTEPRPCPPTAQPIHRVVLTTLEITTSDGNPLRFLRERWPGVEFILPTVGTEAASDDADESWGIIDL